ncbi:DNA-directed RNA polymerase [Campylobacter hyointestinalis]|uniref:DNA-directed RNA polymerase n=1 Tax=Campylobacter hyointestinalis TaxID=198 RepID=UPI000CE31FE9|nr:DNA-directed RNA polymerase [Campylobacter hyointestinalis]PPB51689.1 hypothetical protein CDQ69_08795 [Campylobacter hyointestinalis subsp. hyointestinalis]PPB55996.1 hypothetical protein CDQ67_01795 [Campylobacter hyointestinalis subsp. hyointestinalis]
MTIEDLKDKIYESKLNIKDSLYTRQLELELESINIGVAKAKEEILKAKQNGTYSTSKAGIVLVYQLMQPLAKALVEFIQNSRKGSSIKDMELSELLQKVKLDKASFIILRTILNFMCNKDSVKVLTLSTGISKALLDELNIENFKQSEGNARLVLDIEARDAKRCKSKDRTKAFLYSVMEDKGIAKEILDKEHLVTFGHKLILIFNQATGLLKIRQKKIGKHSAYVVEPTLELAGYIESIEGQCELLNPLVYPMIAPPKDHAPNTYGGFYSGIESLRVPLVKDVSKRHKSYLKDLKIPLVYSAINIIQQTKWCINTRVLEVFKHYLELGIDISELDIPSLDEIPLPPSPYDKTMDKEAFTKFKEENQNLIRSYQTACSEVYSRNAANRSKRILYKTLVNIATKFKDEQGIYFCYDLDWRGRVYSVQSGHCPNPQGMGISKALLKFAEGKAIGSSGGKWLSLHGANAFGDDKLSLEDRFKWAYENERDIIAVAKDPYENKWWWEADDSWKFLAFCFEWYEFYKSGYNSSFKSHIPIALDGTCSGIQHFSALLLDERGAIATNVINSDIDKPSDIYAEVAKVVSKRVHNDALAGIAEARVCDGKIDRSICKRNTMTTPYGVTSRGMIDQLYNELDPYTFRGSEVGFFKVCAYLAKCNYEAIGEVVVASRLAMDWLKSVARVMQKANKVFHWTTPSGFVVKQVYKKPKTKKVSTFWGGSRLRLDIQEDSDLINHKKVIQGQAPNYIHSMDAAHLILSVNKAFDKGIDSFALIHDSFGIYASDCENMLEALKEAFIEMYSNDNLTKFRDEIASQMPTELVELIPPVPNKGNLDITKVKEARYIFS